MKKYFALVAVVAALGLNSAVAAPVNTTKAVVVANMDDVDKLLDQYEKFVDKYIAVMKKAQNGDMTAMTEAASLMQDAEKLQKKLENCKDEMSTAQIARLARIAQKLAKAAM